MIPRKSEILTLQSLIKNFPVVGIIGARQIGKTTLARMFSDTMSEPVTHFDLENPEDLARLNDPMLALKDRQGLIIIDEIQRYQELFPVLRVLADRPKGKSHFLILGSASPQLLRQSSESLAGRIIYHELKGLSLEEVGINNLKRLWLRGGFPRSYLSNSLKESNEWRRSFIQTFLERDIPQLGINIRSITLRRFWTMVAHYHGQLWNASEFGRSFGVADTTVRNYLDLLTSALVIRQLPPWFENLSKRQVKAPKIYIMDSGLLHSLLGIEEQESLESHPKVGASWEGFVIDQLIRITGARNEECYFWGTHAGAELDFLIIRGNNRFGFEIKRTVSPSITLSMRNALSDLNLKRIDVIHAGENTFQMSDRIRAVSIFNLCKDIGPLS
jgi:predicted AAA+ superfamily ATPase